MNSHHALRRTVGRLLIGVLLFAQLAVASHACPGPMGMGPVASVGPTAAAVDAAALPPGCEAMDRDGANLCAEHCRLGQQSVDTAGAPALSLGIPTLLYSLPLEPRHSLGSGRSFPAPGARLAAAPEPPHAILHCVFRI